MPKRRQNGEGTLYQRKNGLWVCELTVGYDKDGKRIKKTLSSMDIDALKRKINDNKYELDRGIIYDSKNLTLNEWINEWLNTYVQGKVKSSTYDNYEYAWKSHIEKRIGSFKLDKITPLVIQSFINKMTQEGYSVSTIKKPYIVLNQAFKKALLNKLVYTNPCTGISFPKPTPRKVVAMTSEEQREFESICQDTTYGNLFLFALNTGMRLGELLALTWSDVDMDCKEIHVKNTVVTVIDRNENAVRKMREEINSAKTDSGVRVIPMTNKAHDILQKQQKRAGVFCFESANGTILERRNVKRALRQLLEKTDIQTKVTMHVLRHSFATRLLEKGANIKAVSEILGHKSIQITLDTYSHVLKDFKNDTINLLN